MRDHQVNEYVRTEAFGLPVYICPKGPDWFVPTGEADAYLRTIVDSKVKEASDDEQPVPENFRTQFLDRIRPIPADEYLGRGAYHTIDKLKECWFHITNRCDMACTHCMFASNSALGQHELAPDTLWQAIDEAHNLGCRIFYFTGGEPFVYPGFTNIVDRILRWSQTHVVVLTNAKSASRFEPWFADAAKDRLHIQVSVDGIGETHNSIRGAGAYDSLLQSLKLYRKHAVPVTLAMSVSSKNVLEMSDVVELASRFNAAGVHFMWLFSRGRATDTDFVPPESLSKAVIAAYDTAGRCEVRIDNIEAIRSQVFTIPGTRFDLSNSAWESLAVGPDGNIYPSPALVAMPKLRCGHVSEGIEHIRRNSPTLAKLRTTSLADSPQTASHPLRFLLGGGDIDHIYHATGSFIGEDPYIHLYAAIALYLIAEHCRNHQTNGRIGLRSRMGECLVECGSDSRPVMFTHSNCVLSLSTHDSHSLVRSFYGRAADTTNEEILNPVSYGDDSISHIPEEMRVRSYGCGSPVLDCDLKQGQSLADLGSGTGIECFIAAKMVGSEGRVYGIDMSESMLARAEKAHGKVAASLGYNNIEFRAGLLEQLPLESNSLDFVISNCVINLTADKRSVFEQIHRVLKPNGMLCISDIVTDTDISLDMKYNERLRGECLGGAMMQSELFAMLAETGFDDVYLVRRYEYRRVSGHPFYAITYQARKPRACARHHVMYRGPYESVTLENGGVIARGQVREIDVDVTALDPESFFVLDDHGNVTNVEQQTACCVFVNPTDQKPTQSDGVRHEKDCLVCGAPLEYFGVNRILTCHLCGQEFSANARCVNEHFVCDTCHSLDAQQVTISLCETATETDPIALFNRIRSHPAFPSHGPEYHSLVPAVIVTAYKNAGGTVLQGALRTAIERGATIPGGACGFLGACGAALGVGTAISVILQGTPLEPKVRQTVQTVTADILCRIGSLSAARCCRRDCLIALTRFVELSCDILPVPLYTQGPGECLEARENDYCIGARCPWMKGTVNAYSTHTEKRLSATRR